MSTNLSIWWKVPNGSTIELWVTDDKGDFLTGARVLRSDEIEWHVFHKHLVPGPSIIPVASDFTHHIRYFVTFQGTKEQEVIMWARVLDPKGKHIPDFNNDKKYSYRVKGKAGDLPARATLMVINEGSNSNA